MDSSTTQANVDEKKKSSSVGSSNSRNRNSVGSGGGVGANSSSGATDVASSSVVIIKNPYATKTTTTCTSNNNNNSMNKNSSIAVVSAVIGSSNDELGVSVSPPKRRNNNNKKATTATGGTAVSPTPAAAVASAAHIHTHHQPQQVQHHQHQQQVEVEEDVASALIISASDKAGMEGIPRHKIDRIILRESGNSLYMQQQRKRDAKVNERINKLKQQLQQQNARDPKWENKLQNKLNEEIQQILFREQQLQFIPKGKLASTCCVVDMDMFYMACEILTKPHLRDVPACVGHNMISTSNYVARRYGVRSAMAGFIGDKLVEELSNGRQRLIHVDHHFDLYRTKSNIVQQVLSEYDPISIRCYSLDEVYMNLEPYIRQKLLCPEWTHPQIHQYLIKNNNNKEDNGDDNERRQVTTGEDDDNGMKLRQENEKGVNNIVMKLSSSYSSCWNDNDDNNENHDENNENDLIEDMSQTYILKVIEDVVSEMRSHVYKATGGLSCSAGIAPNFLLAKMASDCNKPNGQLIVGPARQDVLNFIHPLPTRKVGGIGRVTDKILKAFQIYTVQDLYDQRALVQFLFKPTSAKFLLRVSLGCGGEGDGDDNEEVDEDGSSSSQHQKCISRERTFQSLHSWTEINSRLEDIARMLADDMDHKNLSGKNIAIKVKLHNFDCLSKSRTLPTYIRSPTDLVQHSTELLHEMRKEFMDNNSANADNNNNNQQFSVRLLGVRLSSLRDGDAEKSDNKQRRIDQFLVAAKSGDGKNGVATTPIKSQQQQQQQQQQRTIKKSASPLLSKGSTSLSRGGGGGPSSSRGGQMSLKSFLQNKTDGGRSLSEEPSISFVDCPVCGIQFPTNQNVELNRHLDTCLNKETIKQTTTGVDDCTTTTTSGNNNSCSDNKRQKITHFFVK